QLREILGWSQGGKSYKRIEEALMKWVSVTIFFTSWWDRDTDRWKNVKGFHIVDSVELNDYDNGRIGRTKQLDLPISKIRLGEPIHQSLTSGNMKRLNLQGRRAL
ncbi:MAG: replication initiator protein A, partial [Planctomycetota bacterium]